MRDNANLARTFDEHAARTLAYIDEILLLAKKEYETTGRRFDLPQFYREMRINPNIIRNIIVTDASGVVVLGSHGAPHISLADRPHVKFHAGADTNRIYIGVPVMARVNKQWSFVVTRRANHPDGSLAGVIGVAVNPFYFSNFYKDLNLGKDGTVAFVGLDGIVRARIDEAYLGMDVSKSEVVQKAKSADAGSLITKAAADGRVRIYSYRVLQDYPLIVSVGTSLEEATADVAQQAMTYRIAASIVSLLIVLFSTALIILGRRYRSAEIALRSQQLLANINVELQKKTIELERINQELESFSYSVAHDLRAPVRHMSGYAGLLLEENAGQLDSKGKSYLTRIAVASERMGQLVDDLLKLSRIGRLRLQAQEIDLSVIAREIAVQLAQENPQRQIDFAIAPDLRVSADPGLIRIAVENLLGNAYKYTAQVMQAKIEFGISDSAGQKTLFVRDNGAGFDMKYSEKLFRPFQRLHGSEEFAGSGIGLATVKRIIERHGGRIWVDSQVGLGTTVFFTLGNPD